MATSTINLPVFTQMDATTYKTAIDSTVRAHNEVAGAFAPSELVEPAMAVMLQPATLSDGTVIAAQTVGGIGAPSSNSRVDRIYFDMNSRTVQRAVGGEAEKPVAPSIPTTAYPIARIELKAGDTAIFNEAIIDDRPLVQASPAQYDGQGYAQIYGPDGLSRLIVGKGDSDPRVIIKLPSTGSVEIQDSAGKKVAVIDDKGNASFAGTVTSNATF